MKYGCASLSSDSSSIQSRLQEQLSRATLLGYEEFSRQAGPSNHRKQRRKHDTTKSRSGIGLSKVKQVKMAKKRDEKKKQINKHSGRFVYVGDFEPTVDEKILYDAFAHCGKITRIQIRCSRGAAITIGRPVPPHIRSSRNLQHASIEFTSSSAVRNALEMDGFTLHGRQMVVSDAASDLPEVINALRAQLRRMKERDGRSPSPTSRATPDLEPSQSSSMPVDKHNFMGISFAKTVM